MIGLISAVLGVLAGVLPSAVSWFRDWRAGGRQEYKYCYVKVVHLTRLGDGRAPVYRTSIPRLGREVAVYDEYHYFRLNVFRWSRSAFTCTDRSSGVVDLQILHPWHDDGKLVFTDREAGLQPGLVSQTVRKKSNVFFTKSIYYNGLQSGHEDVAMKMEHHTREARLIVDFSSIPDWKELVPMPGAVECKPGKETRINVHELAPGIFSVSALDVEEETVLRMDFAFRWDVAERARGVEA